jgi:hypothetical protein
MSLTAPFIKNNAQVRFESMYIVHSNDKALPGKQYGFTVDMTYENTSGNNAGKKEGGEV